MSSENVAGTGNFGNGGTDRASGKPSLSTTSSESTPSRSGEKHAFREGDWTCLACGANVFGRNISCFRCLSPKPGTNARHGDWICLNKTCGAHNYASRHTCYRCHVPKGSEKPGDWPCPNCLSNNFASRNECFRCRLPRPPGFGMSMFVNVRPGDWLCPNPGCGSNVFANRETCFRCNTPRPVDAEVASTFSDMRAGDWTCPDCKAMCYANRNTCFRCDRQRPFEPSLASSGNPADADTTKPTSVMQAATSNEAASFQQAVSPQYFAYPPMGYNPYGMTYFPPYYHHHPHVRVSGAGGHGNPNNAQYRHREGDWICNKCKEANFARRSACFKCKEPREEPVAVENGNVHAHSQSTAQEPPVVGGDSSRHHPNKTEVSAQ